MFRKLSTSLAALLAAVSMTTAAGLYAPEAQAQTPAPAAAAAEAASEAAVPNLANAPVAKADAKIDNPYGLEALWKGSDAVAKVVLVLLLIMSMGSWYIIIVKIIEQSKIGRQAKLAEKS
ncbi:hypothetical protein EV670_2638, partial [Rivibacter subsaxonicus]